MNHCYLIEAVLNGLLRLVMILPVISAAGSLQDSRRTVQPKLRRLRALASSSQTASSQGCGLAKRNGPRVAVLRPSLRFARTIVPSSNERHSERRMKGLTER